MTRKTDISFLCTGYDWRCDVMCTHRGGRTCKLLALRIPRSYWRSTVNANVAVHQFITIQLCTFVGCYVYFVIMMNGLMIYVTLNPIDTGLPPLE